MRQENRDVYPVKKMAKLSQDKNARNKLKKTIKTAWRKRKALADLETVQNKQVKRLDNLSVKDQEKHCKYGVKHDDATCPLLHPCS